MYYYLGRRWYSESKVEEIRKETENRILLAMVAIPVMTAVYTYIVFASNIMVFLKFVAFGCYSILFMILAFHLRRVET